MAEFGPQERITFQASFDFRQAQYTVAAFAGDRIAGLAVSATAATSAGPIGVMQTKPNSGQFGTIAVLGRSKVRAGAAFGYGRLLTTNGSGKAIAAGSGNWIIGRALEAAAAEDDLVSAFIVPPYRAILAG